MTLQVLSRPAQPDLTMDETNGEWLGASNWYPSTLLRRESIASILAKFSISNQISPSRSAAIFSQFRGADVGRGAVGSRNIWTLRAAAPEVYHLAKLLGEDAELVGSATLNDLPMPRSWLIRQLNNSNPSVYMRRFCRLCLQEGYHSVFHQVQWLNNCFIHGIRLECSRNQERPSIRRLSNLRNDSCLANLLYEQWLPNDNREHWWGVDVNYRGFGKTVADAESELIRRWVRLCGANDLFGHIANEHLTIAEAECLCGIKGEPSTHGRTNQVSVFAHYEFFVPLTDKELRGIKKNVVKFHIELLSCHVTAKMRLGKEGASLPESVVSIREVFKSHLMDGHSCYDLERDFKGLASLYGWKPCSGLRRLDAWSNREQAYIHSEPRYEVWMYKYRSCLEPITVILMEALEWAWGHAALNDAILSADARPDGVNPYIFVGPWKPSFAIEIAEEGLRLRLICPAPMHLSPQMGLSDVSERCRASMADLKARMGERFNADPEKGAMVSVQKSLWTLSFPDH